MSELAWLESVGFFDMKLGLERMRELADRLGAPQNRLKFLHVAGSNGKGSVCTFLENYDLGGKIIVPFFTYGSTEYLQQSVEKIHEVTPSATHLRTYSGGDVEEWLRTIHIIR